MNFLYFVSLMLMLSLTVQAIPQKMCSVDEPSCGGENLAKSDVIQEYLQEPQKDENFTQKYMKIDSITSENRDLLKMLMVKIKPLLDMNGGCSFKLERILCAKQQIVEGVNTKMVMKICPDQCSPHAATLNQKCRVCKVTVYVSATENIFQINKLSCFGEDAELCGR